MPDPVPTRQLQFVVKISKYCDLRCGYCYEYNELGDRRRMSMTELRRLFEAAARHARENHHEAASFVWHRGEPFLIPLDIYEEIYRLQQEVFGDSMPFWNAIQTNLTVLTDRHIACLKEGRLFRGIGISFDVLGEARVDTKGRQRTDTVLANMQALIDNGIPFGAISVLARGTVRHARDIYAFFDRLGIGSRFLPYYMSASDAQISGHALAPEEITAALKAIFDAWCASATATPVDPIADYVGYAAAYLAGAPRRHYDKLAEEFVLLVNVDGGVWGVSEAYDARYRYGNVHEQELAPILASPNRQRAARDASERMRTHCVGCPYFGHCPGFFVGDATPEQQRQLASAGCPVSEVLGYMVSRFIRDGVPEALAVSERPAAHPALTVAL
jgi:uncharacterized protein